MRFPRSFFVSCFAFFLLAHQAFTQESITPKVRVLARAYPDSIVLRWAPTTPVAWQWTNQSGYVVERYTLMRNGKMDTTARPERIVLSREPLKPLPYDSWEQLVKGNTYAAVALQALYGEDFKLNTPENGVAGFTNQASEHENRYSFALFAADQSPAVAQALGLWYTDRKVKRGEKYVYRVYPSRPLKGYAMDTGFVFVGTGDTITLPKPMELEAEFKDRSVLLSWNNIYYSNLYTAYLVERSDDEGKTFKEVDALPFVNVQKKVSGHPDRMFKVDSLPDNDRKYLFRVRGKTPFGETGPASELVSGMGRQALAGVPEIDKAVFLRDGKIILQWRYPEKDNKRLKEFLVMRASHPDGPFSTISTLPVLETGRTFMDHHPGNDNYYLVRAVARDGQSATSFPYYVQREDSLPPVRPQGIVGTVDSAGVVRLEWQANGEADLMGYRVFRANSPDEEFTQITRDPIALPVFRDSINIQTLTRKVYYRVVALDKRYNPSPFSEALTLARPDVIPPVAANFTRYQITGKGIYLEWVPSNSDDIARYALYRSLPDGSELKVLREFTAQAFISSHTDAEAIPGKTYQYGLRTVDEAGLFSEAQTVRLAMVDSGLRPAIGKVTPTVDRRGKKVQLSWEHPGKEVYRFMIYRSVEDEPLRLYKSVGGDEHVFTDGQLVLGTHYGYKLKALYSDGGESPMTEAVQVKY